MTRHDWSMLVLIGVSALGSAGLTSILLVRWVDSVTMESTAFLVEPIGVDWQPAEEPEAEPLQKTPVRIRWVLFEQDHNRLITHSSYGVTLKSRPRTKPFLTVDPKTGLEMPVRGFFFKPSLQFSFRQAAMDRRAGATYTWKPFRG